MIIADSLAMPRPGVAYENTWIYRLIKAFPDCEFVDRSRRASTTDRLISEGGGDGNPKGADLLEAYVPDLVILQLGIVDCAPRYFKQNGLENALLHRLLPAALRMRYVTLVKRTRTRDPRRAHVSLERFASNLTDYFHRAQALNTRVLALLIGPVTERVSRQSPLIGLSIKNYNEVYQRLAEAFDNVFLIQPLCPEDALDELTSDGYHVNMQGHDIVYQQIVAHQCLA